MVKVNLNVPDEVHQLIKQLQLDLEMKGDKKHLKELYNEIVMRGVAYLKQKPAIQNEIH